MNLKVLTSSYPPHLQGEPNLRSCRIPQSPVDFPQQEPGELNHQDKQKETHIKTDKGSLEQKSQMPIKPNFQEKSSGSYILA